MQATHTLNSRRRLELSGTLREFKSSKDFCYCAWRYVFGFEFVKYEIFLTYFEYFTYAFTGHELSGNIRYVCQLHSLVTIVSYDRMQLCMSAISRLNKLTLANIIATYLRADDMRAVNHFAF